MSVGHYRSWLFDLDGTLTVAAHDFAAIRRMLGLPADRGILEALAEQEPDERERLMRRLDEHEHDLARRAVAAPGAAELMQVLSNRGNALGIITRNSRRNVETTLAAAGLRSFFDADSWVTREDAPPKPDPSGIRSLLARWTVAPAAAVMVGNHRIDVLAGRAAGTATIYVNADGPLSGDERADVEAASLHDLVALLTA